MSLTLGSTNIMDDRQRSQILGVIVVAVILLLYACLRFYFRLG
jgi:hypothetical protein